MTLKEGRVTIPTNLDVVPETIELMKRWGADAIRDCDGTEFPEELVRTGAKIYATYYTTRKDNEWAKANPDEVQQCYVMTSFYTAVDTDLEIPLMKGISQELMMVNTRDDKKRWWEVVLPVMLCPQIIGNMRRKRAVWSFMMPFLSMNTRSAFWLTLSGIRYICTMRLPTTGKTLNIRLLST